MKRREFIKRAVGGAAVVAAAPLMPLAAWESPLGVGAQLNMAACGTQRQLNLIEFLSVNFEIMRARNANGVRHDQIDFYTDQHGIDYVNRLMKEGEA